MIDVLNINDPSGRDIRAGQGGLERERGDDRQPGMNHDSPVSFQSYHTPGDVRQRRDVELGRAIVHLERAAEWCELSEQYAIRDGIGDLIAVIDAMRV